MGTTERRELLKKIEDKLSTRVISYVTGDRKGLETRIAGDITQLFSEHLNRIGPQQDIAVFLYTVGGDSIASWSLVNVVRQYCERLTVIIPAKAFSAGTLITLGADRVVMGPHGTLSPVDPSVSSPYSPQVPIPNQPTPVSRQVPVSVEDMIGFLDLARIEAKIQSEAGMVEVLRMLSDTVHPLALGAVYRARQQGADLARRLLQMHEEEEARIDYIVGKLTTELPTHSYSIGRNDVIGDLKLPIEDVDDETESLIWDLHSEYASQLKLTQPYSAELELGTQDTQKASRFERAVLESAHGNDLHQHIFVSDRMLIKVGTPIPGSNTTADTVIERNVYDGWLPATNGNLPQWT